MRIKTSDLLETVEEEKDLLQQKIDAIDALLAAYSSDNSPTLRDTHVSPATKTRPSSSTRKCSGCGQPGHTVVTCPTTRHPNHAKAPAKKPRTEPDTSDDPDDPDTAAELAERIQELKDEGMGSMAVAVKLHVPLSKVNEYWVKEEQ
ncbi:MAG TPA: hypothetical protein VLC46_26780 [Thermoanaerobaculia bacterium]|jgi:hypothetical protein|nr:hypothetical protein [Thermoanaerobaculia bacterium]